MAALLGQIDAAAEVAAVWQAWNSMNAGPWPQLPPAGPWQRAALAWRDRLLALPDLTTGLRDFAAGLLASPPYTRENPPSC